MNVTLSGLERGVQAADLPLDRLAASDQVSEQEKLAEVSRQFEAILLRQILSQAQKPLFESNLVSSSSSNAIYQDLITQQLADRISEGGSFGFAKLIEKELTVQFAAQSKAAEAAEDPVAEENKSL